MFLWKLASVCLRLSRNFRSSSGNANGVCGKNRMFPASSSPQRARPRPGSPSARTVTNRLIPGSEPGSIDGNEAADMAPSQKNYNHRDGSLQGAQALALVHLVKISHVFTQR